KATPTPFSKGVKFYIKTDLCNLNFTSLSEIAYLRAMYLYNATIIAESDIGEAVRMYVAEQLADRSEWGSAGPSFLKMLDSPHDGVTYCVQLRTKNRDDITSFQETHLAGIRAQLEAVYPGKVLFFDSIMKYLNP